MKIQLQIFFFVIFTAGFAVLPPLHGESGAARASIEVILVKAGDGGGGVDRSLRPYASTLQRLFRFKSYEQAGRTTLQTSVPGESSRNLAGGQSITISASPSSKGLKADIDWSRGSKRLLHTRIHLQPGRPAVLGGPRSNDGTWLLILRLE